jgi:hypothetical protein
VTIQIFAQQIETFSGEASLTLKSGPYYPRSVDQKEITMATPAKARVVVAPAGVVNVHVSADTLYNLEAMQHLQKSILGRLGCSTCCSGRQMFFQQEEGEFTVG